MFKFRITRPRNFTNEVESHIVAIGLAILALGFDF